MARMDESPRSSAPRSMVERAAELELGKTEFVAQAVGGSREALELLAAAGIEQVELTGTGGKAGECDADQAQQSFAAPRLGEKVEDRFQKNGIEIGRPGERVAARDGVKIREADGERDGARMQASVAGALGDFLAEIAERGGELFGIAGIGSEGLIVRKGFCLGIDEKLVRVDAGGFANRAPFPTGRRVPR